MTATQPRPAAAAGTVATFGLSTLAEPYYLPDGRLTFVAPPGAYAAIPAWHSATAWLGAAKLHPRLAAACRGRIAVGTFLALLRVLADRADVATGRDIAVAYSSVGEQLGRCEKTVQRGCRVAEELGLLTRVLDGADMSLDQRITVLGHFTRGTRGSKWRALPNFYAATMPRPLVAPTGVPKPVRGSKYAWSVDNSRSSDVHNRPATLGNVRLPVGSAASLSAGFSSYSRTTTFGTDCAQPGRSEPNADTTAAARPTKAHQEASTRRPGRRLDPAVERFARALRHELLGFRSVSLYRICPGLSSYVSAGLSVSDLRRGLDDYLAAAGRTWLTSWRADQAAEQARYLIGMLNRARMAGYIRLPHDDAGSAWW